MDVAGTPTSFDGQGFEPNGLNQIEPTDGTAIDYQYDASGNLTGDGTWTYSYDAANRLYRMYKTGMSLEFKYDYAGRRVDGARQRGDGHAEWRAPGFAGARGARRHRRGGGGASRQKKVWSNATFSGNPTTWLRYAYQGMELVAELKVNPSNQAITLAKSFHWGLDKSDMRNGAGGAMGLLMWRDYTTSKSYYPSYDLSGNLTGLLDGATGQYVAWYEYDAFGKRESVGGPMAEANPIGFSTQYTDRETGLVYYGFRFYDPSKGRFLNRDPIGEAGGRNLYRFAGNNPIGRVDRWGLCSAPNKSAVISAMEAYNEAFNATPPQSDSDNHWDYVAALAEDYEQASSDYAEAYSAYKSCVEELERKANIRDNLHNLLHEGREDSQLYDNYGEGEDMRSRSLMAGEGFRLIVPWTDSNLHQINSTFSSKVHFTYHSATVTTNDPRGLALAIYEALSEFRYFNYGSVAKIHVAKDGTIGMFSPNGFGRGSLLFLATVANERNVGMDQPVAITRYPERKLVIADTLNGHFLVGQRQWGVYVEGGRVTIFT